MRVDEARPDRGAKRKADAQDNQQEGKRTRRSGRKEQDGVLKGVELPIGRKVKRGWEEGWVGTDTSMGNFKRASKKDKQKAEAVAPESEAPKDKPGDDEKLLFRTQIPSNKDNAEPTAEKPKTHKTKKSKPHTTEVKEFTNTEPVPTFTRDATTTERQSTTFDDSKGWIDSTGAVVEPLPENSRSSRRSRKQKQPKQHNLTTTTPPPPPPANGTSTINKSPTPQISIDATATLSDTGAADPVLSNEPSTLETLFKRPSSKSKSKRPEPIKTFTFFDGNGEGDSPDAAHAADAIATSDPDDPLPGAPTSHPAVMGPRKKPTRLSALQIPPQTPFTRRDLDARGLRSAAPTPDTAAIGKRMRVPWMARSVTRSLSRSRSGSLLPEGRGDTIVEERMEEVVQGTGADGEEEEEEEGKGGEDERGEKQGKNEGGKAAQTEFEKQFYEQRGELNRAWKKQKREASKKGRKAAVRGRGRA